MLDMFVMKTISGVDIETQPAIMENGQIIIQNALKNEENIFHFL